MIKLYPPETNCQTGGETNTFNPPQPDGGENPGVSLRHESPQFVQQAFKVGRIKGRRSEDKWKTSSLMSAAPPGALQTPDLGRLRPPRWPAAALLTPSDWTWFVFDALNLLRPRAAAVWDVHRLLDGPMSRTKQEVLKTRVPQSASSPTSDPKNGRFILSFAACFSLTSSDRRRRPPSGPRVHQNHRAWTRLDWSNWDTALDLCSRFLLNFHLDKGSSQELKQRRIS